MNPHLEPLDIANSLGFTLSGVNVSLANAIRRTLLSDVPLVVFRTTPNERNKCNIITNHTRLNNEIIKQRLSCIPIHIKDTDEFPIKNYIMEVNVENNTDTIMFVTTENFVVKENVVINGVVTGKALPQDKIREIFPPDDTTGYFIDFVRLRPKISDEIPGEKLHLTCEFDIGTAKEDGTFNAVSTSAYGFTGDVAAQDAELARKRQTWKDDGKNEKEIQFESDNWKLLEAKRIFKPDSFDFAVQSVGIHSNNELLDIACKILVTRFNAVGAAIERDELEIKNSENTMANCFDVILENEDYTIGKALEYLLYTKFYEKNILTYCGFKKMHPHDNYSIIRLAYAEPVEKSTVNGNVKECVDEAVRIYSVLKKDFTKFVKG